MEPNAQLDPSVVALTKSIGRAESGGKYNVGDNTGDNANSSGAYQFTPSFLKEWAPKAGVQYQYGMQLNPEQQDKIAYNAVKTMGTTGDPAYPHLGKLTPAQITSAWNTGDPNAYLDPSYGKNNTYGSTQNYVNKVSQYYNEYTGSKTDQTTPPPQGQTSNSGQSDWLTALEGLGVGGLAWLGGHLGGAGNVALRGAGGLVGGLATEGNPLGIAGGEEIGGNIANSLGLGGTSDKTPTGSTPTETPQPQEPNILNEGNQIPKNTSEDFSQSVNASSKLQDAITQSMQGTQTGRVFSQDSQGKDAINTAAMFGLVTPDESGNLQFNEEKRQKLLGEVGNLQDKVIASQGGTHSPMTVSNYAGNFIGKDKINTQTDRNKAAQIVQKELRADAHGVPMNGQMSLTAMREAQKTHYRAAQQSYTNPRPNSEMLAHKALGHAYGLAIREKMQDPELYDRTKKMEQNLINSKQVGKKLNGKAAPKNESTKKFLLTQAARAAEIYIGDKIGGTVGALIGGFVGESLNRKVGKHFGNNIFETKSMKAAMDILKDTKPKEYKNLIEALKQHGVADPEKDGSKVPTTELGKVNDVKKDLRKGFIPVKGSKNMKG